MAVDEPFELLGENTAPNPQEYLMTALNTCVTVGYVAGAAVRGIMLETLEIKTKGELDLRGFLGIDDTVTRVRQSELRLAHQRRRFSRGLPRDPRDRHENLAELFQRRESGHDRSPVRSRLSGNRDVQREGPGLVPGLFLLMGREPVRGCSDMLPAPQIA